MDRFTDELRADLQEVYGVDLAVLWRSRRWVHLLALIDGLPGHSRYVEAYWNDEEIVSQMPESDEPKGEYHPPLRTWTPELAILTEIKDGIAALQQTQVATSGGKPKKVKPSPRPQTAKSKMKKTHKPSEDQLKLMEIFSPTHIPQTDSTPD